jgi:hypothetical protein
MRGPVVKLLVDHMNRASRLFFARGQHRRVHMVAEHPFASELRQKRRMDVENPTGKRSNKIRFHFQAKTRETHHLHDPRCSNSAATRS